MGRTWRRLARLSLLALALAGLALAVYQSELPGAAATLGNPRFGLDHIGYGNRPPDPQRYQRATAIGAGTHRFAFYWNEMEPRPGAFTFASQELTVAVDGNNGLETLAILFGTPDWASTAPRTPPPAPRPGASSAQGERVPPPTDAAGATGSGARLPPPRVGQRGYATALRAASADQQPPQIAETVFPPQNLDRPVFADGTDTLGPNKPANPENYWARFVQRVVAKFRGRVAYWEIWNEPDFRPRADTGWFGFWNGDARQYARLLKVAYLAAKSVDPQATILMGGMMHWQDANFFPQVLQALRADPQGPGHGYFFDGTAWHWYSRSSLIYDKTAWVRAQLERYGIGSKRIWITETNLPVCGDEALGGLPRCEPERHRGTPAQQAAFIVQAAAYSLAAAVERTLIFQYQDDQLGPGDYYGLVRNDGTPRPAVAAMKVATTYLSDVERVFRSVSAAGTIELVVVYRRDGQRVQIAWSASGQRRQVTLPNEAATATAVSLSGQERTLSARGEGFQVELPAATLNNAPPRSAPDYIVGGEPLILVERGVAYRTGNVAGVVRDAAGRVMPGYPVRVGPQVTQTDASGRFIVALPPGLYDAEPEEQTGYRPSGRAYAVPVRGGIRTERDLTVQPLHVIRFPAVAKGTSRR